MTYLLYMDADSGVEIAERRLKNDSPVPIPGDSVLLKGGWFVVLGRALRDREGYDEWGPGVIHEVRLFVRPATSNDYTFQEK